MQTAVFHASVLSLHASVQRHALAAAVEQRNLQFAVLQLRLRHNARAFRHAKNLLHLLQISKGDNAVLARRTPIALPCAHEQLRRLFALRLNKLQQAVITALNARLIGSDDLLVLILHYNKQVVRIAVRQPVAPQLCGHLALLQLQLWLTCQQRIRRLRRRAPQQSTAEQRRTHQRFYLHAFTSFHLCTSIIPFFYLHKRITQIFYS